MVQYVENGVFDAHIPYPHLHIHSLTPVHHYWSTTLGDVDAYLLSKWEQCIDEAVELPAHYIRTYQTMVLSGITSCDVPPNRISQATKPALCAHQMNSIN